MPHSFFIICHRQSDKGFQTLLNNVSTGDITLEDYELLSSRFKSYAKCSNTDSFHNAPRLYSTREEVNSYNLKMLTDLKEKDTKLPVPVARISGRYNCKTAAKAGSDEADGLQSVLYLTKGCTIMLRHNVWTNQGLVNRAIGQVEDIIYEKNKRPPEDLPAVVMCVFDSYKETGIKPGTKIVPIRPATASWTSSSGTKYTRIQFPLPLSYSCSIHKSQGMTLNKAVVDVGTKEFALGLTYVGMSRVKCLDGLLMEPICFERISKLKNLQSMANRSECEEKLKEMSRKWNEGQNVRFQDDQCTIKCI